MGFMRKLINTLYRSVPSSAKTRIIELQLGRAAATSKSGRLRVRLMHESSPDEDQFRIRFERNERELCFFLNLHFLTSNPKAVNAIWKRLPVMIRFLARAMSVREGWVNISDGINVRPGDFAFCSNEPRSVLIPDRFFMNGRSYASFRTRAVSQPTFWNRRSTEVVWRGGVNGHGSWSNSTMNQTDADLKQRVRMCIAAKHASSADIKLTGLEAAQDYSVQQATPIVSHGLVGDRIPADRWWGIKYAVDVDGVTNAWSNLFTRLLMGCCVIKIESPFGYKQWYYDDMKPFEHYVPVKADLSDLCKVIEWCLANDQESRRIARNGQLFAMRRTPESETLAVLHKLNELGR